jgi:hypothetical protein
MRTSIILWIFLLTSSLIISQENISINYQKMDVTNKKSNLLKPVNYGQFYVFQIDDINKFLFQVTIEGQSIILETPIPTELQRLFRLDKEELEETLNDGLVEENLNEVDSSTKKLKANLDDLSAATNMEIELQKQELLIAEKDLKTQKSNTKSFLNSFANKQRIEQVIFQKEEIAEDIEKLNKEMNEFSSDLEDVLNELYVIKIQRVKLINLATRDVSFKTMENDILSDNSLKPMDPSKDFSKLEKGFKQIKKSLDDLKAKLKNEAKSKKLDKSFNDIKASYSELDKTKVLTEFSQVSYLYNELQNETNFVAKAPPVQANGDLVNYEVTITPSRTNQLGAYKNPKTFNFDVPVKGGLKVDFSVGPVFAFGNGAQDEKFFFESTDTENMGILKERDNNNVVNPGVAAMMHYYKRSGNNISWGGLFGIGAGFQSFDDVNISFYGGISVILGKEQKIMLNTGIAFMNVERLKVGEYVIDDTYDTTAISLNDVTENVFKGSFFLSISYSLAKRKDN